MRARSRLLTVAIACCLLAVAAGLAGQAERHRVESVIDGDTVVLTALGTVRLIGVDTPETVDPRRPVEAFGQAASAFLRSLLAEQVVRVEYDQTRTDIYGRTLAYLYLPDGTSVNREIIRRGYGHAYTEFPFRYMDDYRAAEHEAREAQRGLWSDAQPASPDNPLVWIMPTGERYHRRNCRHVNNNARVLPLSEVSASYTPCLVCKPRGRTP